MLPSVDRVGRYFPLTVAAPIREESVDVPSTLRSAHVWLESLEELALEALSPELDFEAFDAKLAGLAMPGQVTVSATATAADDTVPLVEPTPRFEAWPLDGAAETALERLLQERSLPVHAAALWMTNGGETIGACVAASERVISGTQFCALLDGRWSDHEWTLAPCDAKTRGVDSSSVQAKSAEDLQPDAIPKPSSEHETAMDAKSAH